jgi:hypothetical protein
MEEQLAVREGVLAQTGSQLTYVCLTKDHLLRTFTQFDSNYVSKDTCKRVQALLYAVPLPPRRKSGTNSTCS